ncbi:MAG: hypothetical protein SBU_000344 [Candidatus Syntrophoarchaeum butanivorans]|uniref:Uncharacterized protein n=1 Tax=Candidatus Syntropharchaeum butanivorans TaxID=1839936 RepID=A0A1F2P8N3_9EURY|nr:MAG: hypothetical protein SBU_000344 [Candidatus Syntrophoarchaeum butanivorans]
MKGDEGVFSICRPLPVLLFMIQPAGWAVFGYQDARSQKSP